MLIEIPDVLDREQLRAVRELLAGAPFVDGRLSAGSAAQRVKHNEELNPQVPEWKRLNEIVMGALIQHPMYRSAALPNKVATPFYARYTEGMQYGDHVDDPVMGPPPRYRSDIAITVFLSDAGEYDGGELVVRTSFGGHSVKLPAGAAVLYPAASRHHVAPVTRGERLVAVTWVQSLVREPERRELLHELNQARERLLEEAPDSDVAAQVNRAYVNLVRMWSEV